jgi:outer membrane protein assembly factor BamB/ribosomal protein L7/L12
MADNTPTTLTCPSCGAPLEYDGTSPIVRCRFCKNIALVPGLPAAQEATPRASLDEVRRLAQNGNLVDAIRRYRELYGVGLKDAKDAVDALAAGKVVEVHRVFSGPLSAEDASRVLDDVKELLRSGNKIAAIKHYREVNDVSLTQAKDVVDQVEAALTGIPVPPRPGILGQPSSTPQPVKSGKWLGVVIVLAIVAFVGGILAFALSRQGKLFTPQLYASEPVVLVSSGPGTLPDVAALFYNPDADTRLIGLVDGSTGKLRWHAEPLAGDGYADAIAAGGDLLYVANGATLLAYRKSDGSLAWQTQMPDKLNYGDTTLLVTVGRVFTLNVDQSMQAYDAATGNLVWSQRLAGNDRTLRPMGGSLVVLDYAGDSYTYSLIFLDPADGSEQRLLTPTCQYDQYSSATLDMDSGLLYDEAENALFLVYNSSAGCVQRLDFATGQMAWQTISADSFSFSFYGFNALMTDTAYYFSNESQLLAVDKRIGTIQTLVANEDYDFVPLAVTGDTLLVRARRTRGTERFELWGVNTASGKQLWQMDLQGATPIDPPNELSGLVDETDTGWTWRLVPAGLMLIKFQANPNQLVLDTINPTDGTLLSEQTVAMKLVTGDFYSVPTVIGWQDNLVYLSLDSKIYSLDITTGEVRFHY